MFEKEAEGTQTIYFNADMIQWTVTKEWNEG